MMMENIKQLPAEMELIQIHLLPLCHLSRELEQSPI